MTHPYDHHLKQQKRNVPWRTHVDCRIMEEKSFHFKMLIVKLNGKIISKEAFASTLVNDGDRLDIIHLISGG